MKKFICLAIALLFVLPVLPALAENTTLTVESPSLVDISKPLLATLTVGGGFDGADFFIDNKKIYSLSADGSSEYALSIDISDMSYLGEAVLKAVAKYGSVSETVTQNITLTKFANPTAPIFTEDFSSFDGTATGLKLNWNSNNKNVSINKYVYNDSDSAMEITIRENGAFLNKSNMGLQKGAIFTLDFDILFKNNTEDTGNEIVPNAYLTLELRDYNTKHQYGYPYNNGTAVSGIPLFSKDGVVLKGEANSLQSRYYANRWYNVHIIFDTVVKGVKVYMKEAADSEYILQVDYPEFIFDGFKEFRFTLNQTAGNDSVIFDNIRFFENRVSTQWYVKDSVEDGKLKLAFSKSMGNLTGKVSVVNASGEIIGMTGSYDSETNIYTCEFEKPLINGAAYFVKFADGLTSADESSALSLKDIEFTAEKYPVNVTSYTEVPGGISVSVDDLQANGEVMVVCRYNGNKLCDVNYVSLIPDKGNYTVAFSEAGSNLKTVIYILDGPSSIATKEVYVYD